MSYPATDRKVLKRRLDDYLWHDDGMPVAKLRDLLIDHFAQFDQVAVVGGMVRDFARGGVRGFRSDVDLVVNAPAHAVDDLAVRLGAKANSFGGYAYQHPLWKIDFWALETTWAAREGYASVKEVQDIAKCTFFDCDAITYNIWQRTVSSRDDYYDNIKSNIIDVNLRPNPSVNGNLLRAVRRLLCWSATPGPKLSLFIEQNLDDHALEIIRVAEARLYANQTLCMFESASDVRNHLFDAKLRRKVDTNFGEQLELPY